MLDRIERAATHRRRTSSPELDWADTRVAVARERVEQLAKLIDDDMRRGNPTAETRALLATCQRILRETMANRDIVFAEFKKGKPRTEGGSAEAG